MPTDDSGYAQSAVVQHGLVWKLRRKPWYTLEHWKDIENWRRRDFFIKKTASNPSRVGILFVSEKDNGTMKVLATLKISSDDGREFGKTAELEENDEVVFPPHDKSKLDSLCSDLYTYDLELGKRKYKRPELYNVEVPNSLWPLSIKWENRDTNEVTTDVIGFREKAERKNWMNQLRESLGMQKEEGIKFLCGC